MQTRVLLVTSLASAFNVGLSFLFLVIWVEYMATKDVRTVGLSFQVVNEQEEDLPLSEACALKTHAAPSVM